MRKTSEQPIWKLNVQFQFKTEPTGEWVGGQLVCNHRTRVATAILPIALTDYPQFVQDLLKLENLPAVALEELLQFFTGLNNTGPLKISHP